MRSGDVQVEGSRRRNPLRLKMGFAGEDFGYAISLGLPTPDHTAFGFDPEIKCEAIWAGPNLRPSTLLVERRESVVRSRSDRELVVTAKNINSFDSIFSQLADPNSTPEVFWLREKIREWRFYDHFRTDKDSPARQPQIGTRTPVLNHNGSDLAAALQTIFEIGNPQALDAIVENAFQGGKIRVRVTEEGRFSLEFFQRGLLRPLAASELSDGTLRFLLLTAALLTPRPPSLLVLNEPETSLHPDVIPALAKLIRKAAESSQVWVVTHSAKLITALQKQKGCNLIELNKDLGSTEISGQALLDRPYWKWPE
jgi:predicted ATPase